MTDWIRKPDETDEELRARIQMKPFAASVTMEAAEFERVAAAWVEVESLRKTAFNKLADDLEMKLNADLKASLRRATTRARSAPHDGRHPSQRGGAPVAQR